MFRAGSKRTCQRNSKLDLGGKKDEVDKETIRKKTTAPRIPVWSPTMVLTRRHFG
jgi:acetylglutamate kinase